MLLLLLLLLYDRALPVLSTVVRFPYSKGTELKALQEMGTELALQCADTRPKGPKQVCNFNDL